MKAAVLLFVCLCVIETTCGRVLSPSSSASVGGLKARPTSAQPGYTLFSRKLLVESKAAERSALMSLKAAVTQEDAAKLSSWSSSGDPCNGWLGVHCNSEQRVYFIDLSGQGLEATLNSDVNLSALTQLQILWLQGNKISGSLPKSAFAGLSKLYDLKLYDNLLEGALPPNLAAAAKLRRLYLNGNSFSGTLPPEWSSLTSLEELGLASNALEGSVPTSWSEMRNLELMSIHNNPRIVGCLPSSWSSKQPAVQLDEDETHEKGGALNPALVLTQLCGFCSTSCSNPPPPVPSPSPQPPPAVASPSPAPANSTASPDNSTGSSSNSSSPSPDAGASSSNSSSNSSSSDLDAGASASSSSSNSSSSLSPDPGANVTVGTLGDPLDSSLGATTPGATPALPDTAPVTTAGEGPSTAPPIVVPATPSYPNLMPGMPTSTPSSHADPSVLVVEDKRTPVFQDVTLSSSGHRRKKVFM